MVVERSTERSTELTPKSHAEVFVETLPLRECIDSLRRAIDRFFARMGGCRKRVVELWGCNSCLVRVWWFLRLKQIRATSTILAVTGLEFFNLVWGLAKQWL